MSWIVALESEGRSSESLRDILAEDGWLVEAASTYEEAVAAVAERSPQLVIVNVEIEGAARLLTEQSRESGGPGTLVLVAAGAKGAKAAEAADEQLRRPFTDQDLRLAVRNLVTAGRAPKVPPPAADGEQLTSQQLFGDLLAEVEGEEPVQAPAASPPQAEVSPLDRQLSGLLSTPEPKARPAASRRAEPGVDDLLSKTLSGLEIGKRPKRPAAEAGTREATAETPTGKKRARSAEAAESVTAPAATAKPSSAARELDLSKLDQLARPGGKEARPEADALATQKIPVVDVVTPATPASTEFGQYTLLERIAVGGMAEVWKARMKGVEGFQKTVAIKKILPHLTDSSDFVTMFIDEAKLAAQLNHTNIIHIYDLGKIADDYYIAMEYVDGRDLRSILNTAREKSSPLPLPLALVVASRLAGALDHAHRQKDFEGRPLGLVHRDVSPQNVLISFDGDIKLCDFGIVKAVSKASKTQMGALKGKLQYMSPEQAWGRPVDARSDIFSLGSLLFEMLTGRRLFDGESEMSVLDAVREGRVQAPRDLDPRIPLEVNAAVIKALAREPNDRYASAGDFQREIDGILVSLKPTPNQRDLALYVQRLFDVGARPAKAETPEPISAAAPEAAASGPAMASREIEAVPATAEFASPSVPAGPADAALETAPGGKSPLLWVGIAAAVVIGVVAVTLFRGGGEEPAAGGAPATATAPPAANESFLAPQPSGVAGDESATQPAETTDQTSTEPEVEPAPTEPAAAPPVEPAPTPQRSPAPQPAAETPQAPRSQPPATRTAPEQTPAERRTTPPAAEPAPALPPPAVTVASPAESSEAPSAAASTAAPQAATPAPVTPRPTPAPAAARPAPRGPSVREGDLVTLGPGVTPPVLVSVDKPEYPPIARRMRVEGTVSLSVLVDENGRVLDVRLESGVSQNVGINEAALVAARSARFQPATKEGVRVKTWHRLSIPFKL